MLIVHELLSVELVTYTYFNFKLNITKLDWKKKNTIFQFAKQRKEKEKQQERNRCLLLYTSLNTLKSQ